MLLADFILNTNDREWLSAPGSDAIQADIASAQKFALDRSIAVAADSLDHLQVLRILPHCRTPFPLTWIEVAHSDRPEFMAGLVDKFGLDNKYQDINQPNRVGVLIKAKDAAGTKFLVTLFWSFKNEQTQTPQSGQFSLDFDGAANYSADVEFNSAVSEYRREMLTQVLEKMDPIEGHAFQKQLQERAKYDWAGEFQFWFAVLGLLNCRNAVETTKVEEAPKKNRNRIRSGQLPLVDYHLCSIRLGANSSKEYDSSAHEASVRSHFVRGHFKIRKTGTYWWSPFVRGDLSLGFAHKDYIVQKAA